MTANQIKTLCSEASNAGDLATVALCNLALGQTATGHAAIALADDPSSYSPEVPEIRLDKYADPIEDAREGLGVAEAEEIAAEDPALIYIAPTPELSVAAWDTLHDYIPAPDA